MADKIQALVGGHPMIKSVLSNPEHMAKAQEMLRNPEMQKQIGGVISNPAVIKQASEVLSGLQQMNTIQAGGRKRRRTKKKRKRRRRRTKKKRRKKSRRRRKRGGSGRGKPWGKKTKGQSCGNAWDCVEGLVCYPDADNNFWCAKPLLGGRKRKSRRRRRR